MSTEELTCRELVDVVTAYLDDALSPADRARFDEHLAACRHCRVYLEQMRRTIRTLGTLFRGLDLVAGPRAPAARVPRLEARVGR